MRALTGLTPEQLDAVIAHELGHIKRFDVAVNFLQVIAETLFFFHPAVWWLNRRIRADREDCCDDVAVAACGGPSAMPGRSPRWKAGAMCRASRWRRPAARSRRVSARLLGVNQREPATSPAGMVTGTLVLATALVAGAFPRVSPVRHWPRRRSRSSGERQNPWWLKRQLWSGSPGCSVPEPVALLAAAPAPAPSTPYVRPSRPASRKPRARQRPGRPRADPRISKR